MELQGPLGKVSYYSKMPGPGAYPNIDSRDKRAPSLNSRLPDHEFEKTIKVSLIVFRTLDQEPTS